MLGPQFGGAFKPEHAERYTRSPHWDGKKFNNLQPTGMNVGLAEMPAMLREMNRGKALRAPKKPLHIQPINVTDFMGADDAPRFIWYGHSVLLLRFWEKNLLIDPMLGPDASPIAPFKTKRFSDNTLELIDQLPPLDAVLLTHDHYDHLDLKSIMRLKDKTENWFIALGVGRHLQKWGIAPDSITELDWWEKSEFQGIEITATPSRHFSGRGPFDRAKSLWCGFAFKTNKHAIYWSGDGGYGNHFKEIGERLGPFDWGFMECGQYNKRWHQIHMYPEEAVLAAQDVKAKVAMPVHWGGFSLAMHPWKEPVARFVAEAEKLNQPILVPELGQLVNISNPPKLNRWWEQLD